MAMKFLAAAIGLGLFVAASANAGTISGGGDSSGGGLGVVKISSFRSDALNNNDYDGALEDNGNFISIEKTYDLSDLIRIDFELTPTDGITEFALSELIGNNTGDNWIGYVIALAVEIDGVLRLATAADGLSFDETGLGTSAFADVDGDGFLLQFAGGTVAPGEVFSLGVSIDIGDTSTSFALLQAPVAEERIPDVPAPGAAVLLPAVLLALRGRKLFKA